MTKDKCYDWQHLIKTYESIVGPEMLVVEIGSSSPKRTIDLAKSCKKLVGIEKILKRIPENLKLLDHNIEIVKADWQGLSKVISFNSVDIIVASHVIEHVTNDVKCLNDTFRVLKKGGYFLFNTPNRKRLARSIIELFTGDRKFPHWEHMREYTRADLERLINNSDFSYKKAKITGIVLGMPVMKKKLYIKKAPSFLDRFSNYWEILIQK